MDLETEAWTKYGTVVELETEMKMRATSAIFHLVKDQFFLPIQPSSTKDPEKDPYRSNREYKNDENKNA